MAFHYLPKGSKVYHIGFYDSLTGKSRHISAKTRSEAEAKRLAKQKTAELRLHIRDERLIKPSDHKYKLSEAYNFYTTQRNLSVKTDKAYSVALRTLYKAVGDKLLYRYTRQDYFKLIHYLNSKNLAQNSKANYTRHLNTIFNWLVKNKFIQNNFFDKIKEEKKEVDPIPLDELEIIFSYLKTLKDKKYYSIIKSKYLGAYRLGEIVNAEYSDYDFENKIVHIRNSKGKRVDKIPLVKDFRTHLLSCKLQTTGRAYNLSYEALTSFWQRMTTKLSQIDEAAEPELAKYKIKKKYGLHQLRKARGTYLANIGVNPLFLQKYMRHKNFATTQQYYIKINIDLARNNIDDKLK